VAGPKRRIQERLAGFPDLSAEIEDMFSADDKVVTRLVWRGLILVHMRASRPSASARRFRTLPSGDSKDGKMVEISTIPDQFALLKQVGYLPGEVYAV
jgi:predicted ester cyclase